MTLPGDRPRNPHLARDVRLLEAYGRENVFWDSGGRWLQLRSFRIRSPQYRYNMDTTYVILMVPSDYGERAGIGAGLEEFYVHGALRVWHGEDWVSVPHMFDDYDPRGGQAIDMNHQYACCHVNWDPRKHNVLHSLTALALYFSDPWAFEREGPPMSSHRLAGREFLRLSEQQFEELRSYLLQPCGREHKLYAWLGETPGGLTLWRLRVPGEDDYRIRSEGAVEFTMDFIIREALEYEVSAAAGIMDVHSHPFQARAQFSRIDDEFVPRTQRAFERRNPFGTFCRFVTGQDENGFSLQLYDSILDSWNQIDALHVVGPGGTRVIRSHLASCESPDSEKQSAPEEIYQRNEIVRTPAENEGLRQARVMVVGAGGIGWEIARGLAALGVRDLTLVDADVIERANLNRLIEATPRHADRNVPKVRLLSRILRRHDPHRIVTPLEERFPGDEPRALLPNADLVIVGVDDARARHDVLRLCVRHHVPAIDCGTSITMNLDRTRERERNGHVWLYAPGEACWTEMGLTGSELWSDSLRSAQERAGYVLGDPNQSPGSIQSTNKIVAEIAVSLAEAHLVGRRPQYNLFLLRQTTEPEYDLGLKTLRVSRDSGCPLCGDGSFEGMGGDPFVQLEPADTWVPPLDAEDVAPFDPVALRQPADRRPTGVAIE